MKSSQIKNLGLKRIVAYAMVICIMITENSMYILIQDQNEYYYKKIMAALVCILCALGIVLAKKIYRKIILFAGLLLLYFCIYLFATGVYMYYVYVFICPFIAIFAYLYTYKQKGQLAIIKEAFINVMTIEAAVSLFFYICGTQLNILPGRQELQYFWAGTYRDCATYFHLYFDNTYQMQKILSIPIMRNTGVFAEAPGHAGILTYAFILEMINVKDKKKLISVKGLILAMTLLSTLSSKAFVTLAIALFFWYLMNARHDSRTKNIVTVIVLVITAIVLVYLLKDKTTTGSSFATRLEDLKAELLTWREYPIFGVGYGNTDKIAEHFSVSRSNGGLSMGITAILAEGGVYLLSLYIFAAVKYLRSKYMEAKTLEGWFVIAVLSWNLFISNSGFTMAFSLFVCFGLVAGTRISKGSSTSEDLNPLQAE